MYRKVLIFFFSALSFTCCAMAAAPPRFIPKPRPVAGIGILTIHKHAAEKQESIVLYQEPGLMRTAAINPVDPSPFEHVFGNHSSRRYLIVTKRHQQWVKVIYDDAGREGWLKPDFGSEFNHYADWLRQPVTRLLPALQKKYYQLHRTEDGAHTGNITPKQNFKILKVHNSWAQVLTEQNQLAWLQWKDDDGHLLIGLAPHHIGDTP